MNATLLETQVSPLDLTDESLMTAIQARDEEALSHLHDRYAGTLKALIMRVLHNEADADDMLQEIFVELWSRADSYDATKGKPLGWLVTLSRRRAIDRLRKRDAYCRAGERLVNESKSHPQFDAAPVEEEVAMSDLRERMQGILATLPEAQRAAVELAFYSGMSQREIAAHTGIPLGTIKTRIELGLKKIAAAVEGMEDYL